MTWEFFHQNKPYTVIRFFCVLQYMAQPFSLIILIFNYVPAHPHPLSLSVTLSLNRKSFSCTLEEKYKGVLSWLKERRL